MCIRDRIEDYDPATCTVTAIPEVVVSSDLSGIVEVPQGSTKDFVVNSPVSYTHLDVYKRQEKALCV